MYIDKEQMKPLLTPMGDEEVLQAYMVLLALVVTMILASIWWDNYRAARKNQIKGD